MNDANLTDQDLAVKARRDRGAFMDLYQRHIKRVYGYHLVRTSNDQDAQDLTSETFLAAMNGIANYRPNGSFYAWLMGIAYHKLIDYYRENSTVVSLDNLPDPPEPGLTLEKHAARQSDLTVIRQAIKSLTPDRANAISLRYFGGLNVAETARVMEKTPAAVKMLVMRGLQDIRDHYNVVLPEEVNHE
jgi:RNA polymerase sigma-70 factor (ECF subfamily)